MLIFQDLKDKTDIYFGTGSIGILFVCGLLFWLVKKEKSPRLRLYVNYLVVALIGMLNPLSLYVIDKTGNMGVYERFFWLLMTPCLVALTFAVLVQKKNYMLIPALILILLCGESVFTDTEYKPAENPEKISQEAIQVSDIIMRDFEGLPEDAQVQPNKPGMEKLPRAIVTEPVCEDIRMYNANIQLWYVRKDFGSYNSRKYGEIAEMFSLTSKEILLKDLIKAMKKYDFQYFVIGNWQQLTGNTNNKNIEKIGQTATYQVYRYNEPTVYTMRQYADVEDYQCMSYIIRSSTGGLIVVDGGRAWQSETLVKQIKKYGGVVDGWIITHPHDDHCGVLASVLAAGWDQSEIEIKQIYIGEMDYEAAKAQSDRADTYGYLLQGLEGHDNVTWLKAGDELDIIGLHMKVLHTCNETVLANSDNVMNDGSMVFKLSGKKKSVLFLADVGDNDEQIRARTPDYSRGSEIGRLIADEILAAYPEDVKADIVQMSHHGNGSLPDYFYEAVEAKTAFFDAPDWLMENRNKETGVESYYSTPHYKALMERLGTRIISYSSKKKYVRFR